MMLLVAKRQLLDGLRDSKYLFAAILLILAFAFNGMVYSGKLVSERQAWLDSVNYNNLELNEVCADLQDVAGYKQRLLQPVSSLAFIADHGAAPVPNLISVSAFEIGATEVHVESNEQMPLVGNLDWSFIIGILTTLVTILISYSSINGEKVSGTLKLVLAYPVSRFGVLAGKYLGTLVFVFLTLVCGSMLSLGILVLNGAVELTAKVITAYGWVLVLALLACSLTLLFSMSVSSLASRPSVSLIACLAIWTIVFIVYPGFARLVSEDLARVKSPLEVAREHEAREEEEKSNHPMWATNWTGDPKAPNMPDRLRLMRGLMEVHERITFDHLMSKAGQFRKVRAFSALSPHVLLGEGFQALANTGSYAYENLVLNGRRFRRIMLSFVEEKDSVDPDSPHMVYGNDGRADYGTFSMKGVDRREIPAWSSLWDANGLPETPELPYSQCLVLLIANVALALLFILSFLKCDPR